MDDCTFCRIASGDADEHVLYADDRTVAFLDANPATEGHTLVVPRHHETDLMRADEAVSTAVTRAAATVADGIDAVLDPDGFSVFHSAGGLVGNVEHAHLHLLPRFEDDDIGLALERDSLADHDPASFTDGVRSSLSE